MVPQFKYINVWQFEVRNIPLYSNVWFYKTTPLVCTDVCVYLWKISQKLSILMEYMSVCIVIFCNIRKLSSLESHFSVNKNCAKCFSIKQISNNKLKNVHLRIRSGKWLMRTVLKYTQIILKLILIFKEWLFKSCCRVKTDFPLDLLFPWF